MQRSGPAATAPVGRRLTEVRAWINIPALMAVLIWSAMYPVAKYGLAEFPVMAFVTLRPILAGALLFAGLRLQGRRLGVDRADWLRLGWAGVASMGAFQLVTFAGLKLTSATHSILLNTVSPLISAGILWGLRHERPSWPSALGLGLGFLGVVVLVERSSTRAEAGGASLGGDLLVLLGTLAWVGVTAIPRRLVGKYGATTVTAWLALLSGLALLPFSVGDIAAAVVQPPSTVAWLSLLYSAVMGMIVATALWQRAAHALGSTQALTYVYLEPLIGVGLAMLLLGETIDAIQVVAALALLLGLGLGQRGA